MTRSPGRSGLGPMACRVNQRSRRTRSWLQWLAGSTTYLVGAGAMFQCLRCRTALPGISGPYLRPAISTNCTGQLVLRSAGPWGRPAFPGDSGSGPMARRVDKLSQVTRALGPRPTVSTSCPGRLRPGSEVLRGRPALQGNSHSNSGTTVSTSCARGLAPGSDCPWGQPAVPGDSGQCPRGRDVEQLLQATRAQVRGPAGLTSSPGRLGNRSVVPRGRPAHPGDTVPVRGPTLSNNCPGRLSLGSEGPWF